MVAEVEDQLCNAKRGYSYLGNPSKPNEFYPDMLKFGEDCGIPAARVTKKDEVKAAVQKMLDTPGPYLLDVIMPVISE